MTTNQKIIIFGLALAFFSIISVISYNIFERKLSAKLYRECLELREKLQKEDPRSTNWCYK